MAHLRRLWLSRCVDIVWVSLLYKQHWHENNVVWCGRVMRRTVLRDENGVIYNESWNEDIDR